MALLYHDINAMVLYIQISWGQTGERYVENLERWIKLLMKLETKAEIENNK